MEPGGKGEVRVEYGDRDVPWTQHVDGTVGEDTEDIRKKVKSYKRDYSSGRGCGFCEYTYGTRYGMVRVELIVEESYGRNWEGNRDSNCTG